MLNPEKKARSLILVYREEAEDNKVAPANPGARGSPSRGIARDSTCRYPTFGGAIEIDRRRSRKKQNPPTRLTDAALFPGGFLRSLRDFHLGILRYASPPFIVPRRRYPRVSSCTQRENCFFGSCVVTWTCSFFESNNMILYRVSRYASSDCLKKI